MAKASTPDGWRFHEGLSFVHGRASIHSNPFAVVQCFGAPTARRMKVTMGVASFSISIPAGPAGVPKHTQAVKPILPGPALLIMHFDDGRPGQVSA